MDMARLFAHAFPAITIDASAVNATPFIARMRLLGQMLASNADESEFNGVDRSWISDTIRGWCAMAVGTNDSFDLETTVDRLKRYAADHHFAVREWSWLALRSKVVHDPTRAVEVLTPLAQDVDPRIRRFAVESTRPRSVWGAHIAQFKYDPSPAAILLGGFRCDEDRYVQDAVANWINDVALTNPAWVASFTTRWLHECDCRNTRRISARARRRLRETDL